MAIGWHLSTLTSGRLHTEIDAGPVDFRYFKSQIVIQTSPDRRILILHTKSDASQAIIFEM
jgi:hypothetical protein